MCESREHSVRELAPCVDRCPQLPEEFLVKGIVRAPAWGPCLVLNASEWQGVFGLMRDPLSLLGNHRGLGVIQTHGRLFPREQPAWRTV